MAEKTVVTMEDGSEVKFGAKQRMIKTSSAGNEGISCKLDFVNGKQLIFNCTDKDMLFRLARHGAEQKLGDSIAGVKDIDDAVMSAEGVINRLADGQWLMERASGMAGTSILLTALVEFSGKAVEEIKEFLGGKTPQEKNALKRNPKIKVIVDRIIEEKAAAQAEKNPESVIDTDALLATI